MTERQVLTRNTFRHSRSSFPLPITPSPHLRHRRLGMKTTSAAPQQGGLRRHSMASYLTPSNPDPLPIKYSKPLVPLWQSEDEAYEQRLRSNKRNRAEGGIGHDVFKRISVGASASRSVGRIVVERNPNSPKSHLERGMKLRVLSDQGDSGTDDDEPRYRPRAKITSRKTTTLQTGLKRSAARKIEIKPATSSSEEDSDVDDFSAQSESSSREDGEVEALEIDHLDLGAVYNDIDMDRQRRNPLPSTAILYDTPPRITIPLPQLGLQSPPESLIVAIEALSLSCVRMQKARQLPFLRRNLRCGFERRCLSLGVPTTSDTTARPPSICVRYEHVANLSYETWISAWLCPLCDLHGEMKTREMLSSHLQWDHNEAYVEWEKGQKERSWTIKLLIPEVPKNDNDPARFPHNQASVSPPRQSSQTNAIPTTQYSVSSNYTPPVRPRDSLFPYVTLSPATPTSPTPQEPRIPPSERDGANAKQPTSIESRKPAARQSAQGEATRVWQPQRTQGTSGLNADESDDDTPRNTGTKQEKSQATRPTNIPHQKPFSPEKHPSRLDGTTPSSSRARSTTVISVTTATTEKSVDAPYPSRYPTPPPRDNPLGAAAQPPYFPAQSDYGGPSVYYSCRPGGPSLLDLLDTLPLEPFGVLDWAVLDREDEIFESDDVKDEYKVMHALWARWIVLNRNKFVANYHKGTIAFVDSYWKMIHRAAGWDALRYWLLMLLANRFLSGHEVAEVLQHYERDRKSVV